MPGYPSFARRETQVQYQIDGVQLINTKPIFTETLKDLSVGEPSLDIARKSFLEAHAYFQSPKPSGTLGIV
jgi:hypothetical protein